MKLSIVIPAYNEEHNISDTIEGIVSCLSDENIPFSILVVNDNSRDGTAEVLARMIKKDKRISTYFNKGPNGFGYAIRAGLERHDGDCVAIMMADASDDPNDLVLFYRKMVSSDLDCVFGSRFIKGGATYDYPKVKKVINRIVNNVIKVIFGINYNDTTNAFKLYKKETIEGIKPFLSPHFNLTVELPLKAIIRGYSYGVLPNSWKNRKVGESNLKIREMGSRYFFIVLYCLIEKYFSRGDFKKKW